ncbi:MAG: hypothetical protein E6300_14330 [Clostridium sp.]|uniref:hypothetical protein n=1 Tax=Clostridium sp. TaxID=1506 RepID=UPI001ECD9AD2|nr:hypothetical protein [Clostridium sp.]MBS5885492.1 hypothetical protein [Clostridium sp.]MDU7149654.1 hypothetical protein [Clostridium sp.]MDU7240619.1 hypothetical protein [Clostridium sp.]
MKIGFKILLIGVITTIFRIIGQLLIPLRSQNILLPSIFVKNGTMPLVFSIYGVLAYSFIALMFLLIRNQLSGNKVMQGFKYGISCCLVWIAYLLEPLPHVAALDRITYPVADGLALIVMGILLGFLTSKDKPLVKNDICIHSIIPLVSITICFVLGRLIQYSIFDIYSSFSSKKIVTILWSILTGSTIACVLIWLNRYVKQNNFINRALILGCLLFGLDLTLFNFFMPLVFNADILDLILRTVIDFSAVTIGSLSFGKYKQLNM